MSIQIYPTCQFAGIEAVPKTEAKHSQDGCGLG